MQLRMQSAELELEAALSRPYYTFIINDKLEEAATKINHIVRMDEANEAEQTKARQLAQQLLLSTKDHLANWGS